jgi:hypothetical protein
MNTLIAPSWGHDNRLDRSNTTVARCTCYSSSQRHDSARHRTANEYYRDASLIYGVQVWPPHVRPGRLVRCMLLTCDRGRPGTSDGCSLRGRSTGTLSGRMCPLIAFTVTIRPGIMRSGCLGIGTTGTQSPKAISSGKRRGKGADAFATCGVSIRYPVYATSTCAAARQQLPSGSILSRDWPLPAFREHPQSMVGCQRNQ